MSIEPPRVFFVGWDVGGWNCDKNPTSRDAVVVLDETLAIVGRPWRGNLRQQINAAANTRDWVAALFTACAAPMPTEPCAFTLAIDTPLGFSQDLVRLITGLQPCGPVEKSNTNPYLFRRTERWLFEQGLSPLSAVKDMIGSQATKGMHALARFAPVTRGRGVWCDSQGLLTAIETYPAACAHSARLASMRSRYPTLSHADQTDALTCALVASLFAEPAALIGPVPDVPASEGWIWLPSDAVPIVLQDTARPARYEAGGSIRETT